MKRKNIISSFLTVFLVGSTLTGIVSCREKKQSDDIITTKPAPQVKMPTQKVGDYEQTTPVEWTGSTYQVEVIRKADESLPTIDDGTGNKYYDNKISLRVIRKDGSEFFSHSFTKDDFSAYVDAGYRKHSALLGIVFDKAEGNQLVFAASIGSPDKSSDEYIPMLLKLSSQGNISITKDTRLDTDTEGEDTGQGLVDQDMEIEEEDGV